MNSFGSDVGVITRSDEYSAVGCILGRLSKHNLITNLKGRSIQLQSLDLYIANNVRNNNEAYAR